MVEHNQSQYYGNQYKFNGKELDSTTGMYYYGARYYEPRFSIFVSVDPLVEMTMTPYQYVNNNPINFIDPDGLFPRPLLIYNKEKGSYKFTKSAVHLLHLVSGVSKPMIENAQILKRGPGKYVPFYSSNSGGGAITLGSNGNNGKIIYTQNYFEDDKSKYNGKGYGQDIKSWLSISAHEVGHLPQIDRQGGAMSYLGEFVKQYTSNGHDDAPYEIEADKGYKTFKDFKDFVDREYGKDSLIKVFEATEENDGYKGTESYKIKQIDKYWNKYQKSTKNENK